MDERIIQDDVFGELKWDVELQEWQTFISVAPHQEQVLLSLPPEYVEVDEVKEHIRATLELIRREEDEFRHNAADEHSGEWLLFWPEDQPFDREVFAQQMNLGNIVFNTQFPQEALTLWYEYGERGEHGITIFLSWNGAYQTARTS